MPSLNNNQHHPLHRIHRAPGRRERQPARPGAGIGERADVHARHRADSLHELCRVSSRGRDRADVAHHVCRGAAVGQGHRAAGVGRRDAAVARRRATRHVPKRAQSHGGTKGSDRAMGRGRCARRGSGGPSAGPDIRVRLGDRSAGCDLRDAGGLPRSCERHDRVRALLHPDELHRREMAAGDRGAAGQSIARASRARVLRDASGRSAHAAGAAAQSAGQPHHGRARSGQPAAARRQRRQSSAGHLRARDEAAGLSRRHSAASAARWRAASADALHREWQGGHRSHPGSA